MLGWLRGQHKSREAAEQALAFARDLEVDARGLDDARLVFERAEITLLAPLPRPNSLRDFSIFEEHMTRREGGGIPKRAAWFRFPPYYKGNPDTIIGPEDPIPFPYYTQKLDLELEIGIVIGRGGSKAIPPRREAFWRTTWWHTRRTTKPSMLATCWALVP
jgi:2-keto-4-pentenoate hydratase/2-oxohepta-3-ene-1,7-dioic acid hydratase in catechol pathway